MTPKVPQYMQWNLAQSISSASKKLRVWITEAMESRLRYMQWNLVQGISQPPPRYHLHQMNPTSTMKLCHQTMIAMAQRK